MRILKHLDADIAQATEMVNGLQRGGLSEGYWFKRLERLKRLRELRDRPLLSAADLAGVTHVRLATGWAEIVRVNKTTVTIAVGSNPARAVPFASVIEARSL